MEPDTGGRNKEKKYCIQESTGYSDEMLLKTRRYIAKPNRTNG